MASSSSRVPMTLRDFFFTDPFFRDSWDDFDKVRKEMMRESADFWKNVEKDMSKMESEMSSMMSSSSSSKRIQNFSSSSSSSQEKKDGGTVAVPDDSYSPWFFPRRWMMPKLFGSDDDQGRMRSLDLFQHKEEEVIRIKDDDDKFELSLDVHSYRPDEIRVNVSKGLLSVEAKHEEKSDNKFESRQLSRSYTLPAGCQAERVTSNLSSDGVLVVTAPKVPAVKTAGSTAIPVEHK